MTSNGTHTSSADAAASSSSSSSTTRQQSSPPAEWLASIDAVYSLFEDPSVAQQYPQLSQKVKNAVQLCEEVIQDVGQQHCALSFNGGKDCTVLVHILSAVLRRLAKRGAASSTAPIPSIPSLYITCPSPFPTVEKFIKYCISPVHGYNLQVISVAGGMKQGIRTYLDGGGREQVGLSSDTPTADPVQPRDICAIFVGTRRDDPHGPQLSARSWTDKDWPRVERIHPILDWSYQDVWQFLRCPHLASSDAALEMSRSQLAEQCGTAGGGEQGVPYCLLYDQGYTSLGSTYNTLPNPELRVKEVGGTGEDEGREGEVLVGDGTAKGRWRPAYMLQDGSLERAGRVENASPAAAAPQRATT
ncbi:related to FAD1-flavin adenine dinucleotide synthetase [Sporisorium scitamineum]|uniref:FAD synthase n=1 Tax=Sporisorium scitamineum TaxID=49012 RepID=A0A0F7S8Q7_9BASI|nr:related to FAD1-flavin adenine dinucleotide synthetase [Sporisorium scitamineum]CDW98641.1 hypothetical protein [Sporisorium scitamineum]